MKYYSLADIFVICSQKETFSMTCAEAISCGTQVIGFKSGAPETVFLNSIFVDYGDLKTLKKEIENYLQNNLTINTENMYSIEKMFQGYLRLYTN